MKNWSKIVLSGFLLWAVIFGLSYLFFPLELKDNPVAEPLVAVSITVVSVLFSIFLFKNVSNNYLKTGIQVGFVWMIQCILLDLPLLTFAPLSMTIGYYLKDIATTYLIIPIVTSGFGWILNLKRSKIAS